MVNVKDANSYIKDTNLVQLQLAAMTRKQNFMVAGGTVLVHNVNPSLLWNFVYYPHGFSLTIISDYYLRPAVWVFYTRTRPTHWGTGHGKHS